jgi:hypothetical protein
MLLHKKKIKIIKLLLTKPCPRGIPCTCLTVVTVHVHNPHELRTFRDVPGHI